MNNRSIVSTSSFIALAICMVLAGIFFGRGCAADEDVERRLEESRARIEQLGTEKDSIEALRAQLADTLAILIVRIEDADADRETATRQTRLVLELINSMSSYENLTHDALAEHADSLYLARADNER